MSADVACGCTAWIYNDEDTSSKHALHQHNPPQFLSHEDLGKIGVLYFKMEQGEDDPKLAQLRKERGYTTFDIVHIKSDFPQEKLDTFFDEHLHEDEEIRLCLEGSGFFDVRSKDDKWIRIHCKPGDLLIVPSGIYHRFTLDEGMYIKTMRIFTEAPKWIAFSRQEPSTETNAYRQEYCKLINDDSTTNSSKKSPNGIATILDDGPQALAHYPHARTCRGLIYLSGFSSRRPDNTHRGAVKQEDGTFKLDIYEQTIGVIENMKSTLEAAGASLHHLLDITVFLTDMADFPRFNQAYNTYFNAETGPTRTTVAVRQLPHPNLVIEIKGVASAPE